MNLHKLVFRIMIIVVPIMMVLTMAWNFMVFQDCRAHGKAMYQCQAAISNPHYVAVEDIGDQQ